MSRRPSLILVTAALVLVVTVVQLVSITTTRVPEPKPRSVLPTPVEVGYSGSAQQDAEKLHEGMFQHMMYHYRHVRDKEAEVGEGEDGYGGAYMFPLLTAKLVEVVRRDHVHTLCETGFGVGHSAVLALQSDPTTHVYSFDMMDISSKQWSRDQLDDRFPGRLTVVDGDTQVNVPKYLEEHPDLYCDVIFPDEGQEALEIQSLNNMLKRAHCGSVVVVDWGLVEGTPAENAAHRSKAWQYLLDNALVDEVECILDAPRTDYSTRKNILSRMCLGKVHNCKPLPPGVTTNSPPTCKPDVWSIAVFRGPSPYELEQVGTILTADLVTDVPADFIADPQILQHDGQWTMFFEIWPTDKDEAVLGAAQSSNLVDWTYLGQVDVPWEAHLAFPYVFEHDGEQYMVPNVAMSDGTKELFLFKAAAFPMRWEKVTTLLTADTPIIDAVVFQHGQSWYIMWSRPQNDFLRLHVAPSLEGPYREHPASPIHDDRPDISRPAGRVSFRDGRLFRYAQDCEVRYGRRVYEVEVLELTENTYRESETPRLILEPTGWPGWHTKAMHTFDLHEDGAGAWVAAVDGTSGC